MSDSKPEAGRATGPVRRASDDDIVARLMHIVDADPRPAPGETEALIRHLRPHWREAVRARTRRRLLWPAATLAAAAVLVAAFSGVLVRRGVPSLPGPPVATVVTAVGGAEVTLPSGKQARWTGDAAGRELAGGSAIVTLAGGRLALRLAGGQSLRLDADSEVRLDSAAVVTLAHGAAYVDSAPGGGVGVEVRTPLGTAYDVGTQFEVRVAEPVLTVRVREGTVLVSAGDRRETVASGVSLSVAPGRAPERTPLARSGAEWSWTQEVAPPLAIDGRSADELLAWVARESGLEVVYADADTARAAREAVMHGTLRASTPLAALDVLLPVCGLRSVAAEGAIIVARDAPVGR